MARSVSSTVIDLPGSADTRTVRDRSCRTGVTGAICAILLTVSLSAGLAAEGLRIVPLVRDDSVLVSFELTDGYTEEVKDAVHSGLKTTFTYTVELRQDVPAWVDRTIATSVITNTVQYDNLTRRATLVRTLDGHVESTQSTEDASLYDHGPGTEPRVLRAGPRDCPTHERVDALAVGQRHFGHHEVHIPQIERSGHSRRSDSSVRPVRSGRSERSSSERSRSG
jgi:hypothetical protein